MDKIRKNQKPEAEIQERVEDKLRKLGWMVESMHGNLFQFGIPDLYAAHPKYGTRWIEVKNPEGWHFTPAQMQKFPIFCAHGAGIWIVFHEREVPDILFKPSNFYHYCSAFQVRGRRG